MDSSAPTVRKDDVTSAEVDRAQLSAPLIALKEYRFKSLEAMYTEPDEPTAGEPSIASDVVDVHAIVPVDPSKAYSVLSSLPTYTSPVGPTAGEENTMPPLRCDHTGDPDTVPKQYTV